MSTRNSGFSFLKKALEAVSGAVTAVPFELFLYFMSVLFWASAVEFLAIPFGLVPYAGVPILTWMNFTPSMVPLLMLGAVAIEIGWCRFLVKKHLPVFAYTQAVISLAVSSPLYYWTAVHHRPMIPFYGQQSN